MRSAFSIALVAFLVVAAGVARAQQPMPGLKKSADGKAFEHEASKTTFTLPADWTLLLPKDGKPDSAGQVDFLSFRKVVKAAKPTEADQIFDVTVSWSPLGAGIKMKELVDLEAKLLKQLYGEFQMGPDGQPNPNAKKVEEPVADKPGERDGFLIVIHDGPTRDGKEAGLVYLFDTGSDPNHWKIKIRATYPLRLEKEGQQLLKEFAKNLGFK